MATPSSIIPGESLGEVAGTDPKKAVGIGMPRKEGDKPEPLGDKFYTFMTSKWEDLRTAYTVYHQLCWQNILYYAGQLWILWDKDRRIWYPAVPEDEYTPQPQVNEFAPAIDSITSVFQIPNVECGPKTDHCGDEGIHEVAEIANVLAREFMRENGLLDGGQTDNRDGVGDYAGQLFTLCGNVFTIVTPEEADVTDVPDIETVPMTQMYCPGCNYANNVPPDSPELTPPLAPSDMLMGQQVSQGAGPACPQCGGQLQLNPTTATRPKINELTGQPVTNPVITWKVCCKVGNPLFALPRPGAVSFDQQGYLVWAERLSLDAIFEKWQFEAQADNQYLDSMESSWEISMNYYFTGYSNLTLATKESALVCLIFVEPGKVKDLQEGGVGVYVNNQIIKVYTWEEYCSCGWAITHFGYLKMPTTYFFRSSSFDLAQIQKELNRYESIIALHSMTSASDSVVIDENTKVSNISGRGDRIVYWRSIGPGSREPHRMQHGSLDEGVYAQRQRLRDAMQNISGAVAVWRGQQTGSVTAASGIAQLRGQAEQMFSKPTKNWNSGWVNTIKKGVELKQKYMQPWEINKLMGGGHDIQIAKFKQTDLDEVLEWAASQHGLPRTREERRTDLLDLHDRGLLDVTDPSVQDEIGQLFGETGMKDEFNTDATRARWENTQMAKGVPVQFMPDVEDLQVHLTIHGKFIKNLSFETLPPPVQQGILEHYMETKMALTQQALMSTESQVEYKAAAIGKPAPIQPKPGTLLTGGGAEDGGGEPPAAGKQPAPNKGGRGKAAPGTGKTGRPVPAGTQNVPTGPAPGR